MNNDYLTVWYTYCNTFSKYFKIEHFHCPLINIRPLTKWHYAAYCPLINIRPVTKWHYAAYFPLINIRPLTKWHYGHQFICSLNTAYYILPDLASTSQEKMSRLAYKDAAIVQLCFAMQESIVSVQMTHLTVLSLDKEHIAQLLSMH